MKSLNFANRLLCGIVILVLIPQFLTGEELKTGRLKWETIHGAISTIEGRKIKIQDSTGKIDFAEIGLGPNRIDVSKISIGQTVTIAGMRERNTVDAVFLKTITHSFYRYDDNKDSALSRKLGVTFEEYQITKEMQGYKKRADISKGVMFLSFALGVGLISIGAGKIQQGKKVDPKTIFLFNEDIALGGSLVLGGIISVGRGLIFIIPSVTQKHKYDVMHSYR